MFLNKNLLFVVTTETWRKIKDGVVIGAVARHWTTPVGGQTLLVFRNNTATANAAVTTWIWNSKMSAEIHRNCKICSEQSAADLTNAWFLRGPGQLCSYGQSPSKDTVQSGGGGGGVYEGQRRKEGRHRKKAAGMTSAPSRSQPLGEVFREYSFCGVFLVLLPVLQLDSHQPAVILPHIDTQWSDQSDTVSVHVYDSVLTCSSGLSKVITSTTSPTFISSSSVSLAA